VECGEGLVPALYADFPENGGSAPNADARPVLGGLNFYLPYKRSRSLA